MYKSISYKESLHLPPSSKAAIAPVLSLLSVPYLDFLKAIVWCVTLQLHNAILRLYNKDIERLMPQRIISESYYCPVLRNLLDG